MGFSHSQPIADVKNMGKKIGQKIPLSLQFNDNLLRRNHFQILFLKMKFLAFRLNYLVRK